MAKVYQNLLLEDGEDLLLENGENLQLEQYYYWEALIASVGTFSLTVKYISFKIIRKLAGTSYGSTVDVKTLSAFIPRIMWFN